MAAHYYDLKVLTIFEHNQWIHLHLQGSKRNIDRFDNAMKKELFCIKSRKPKECKDIGGISRQIGTQFEYKVRNAVKARGWRCERRSGSGAASGQKGDVVIFDNYNNEILTLEATKTRGKKSITIPQFRLDRILSGESEAIIFELGGSTQMYAIIPWDSDKYPDITFVEALDEFIETGLEPGSDEDEQRKAD